MLKLKRQYFWSPDANSWLIGKDPDAGKDWGQEEKAATEDEMVGWHHWFNGHELCPGDSEGQGRLVCCSLWGRQELDMTWPLNNNEVHPNLTPSCISTGQCTGADEWGNGWPWTWDPWVPLPWLSGPSADLLVRAGDPGSGPRVSSLQMLPGVLLCGLHTRPC